MSIELDRRLNDCHRCAVFAGKNNLIAVLLVAAFGFGLTVCFLACRANCDEDCAKDHTSQQCASVCFCQLAALPVIVSSHEYVATRPQLYVVIAEPVKLPGFPAEIFNPPKA